MLSNIVMKPVDEEIAAAARKAGLIYTRYSDDLTFSTPVKEFDRSAATDFVHTDGQILATAGFRPQHRKTRIILPGSPKIVLGLNVDGTTPKLRREFKDNLRLHLHYLDKFGPAEHAKARQFETIWGMKAHIRGLIDFANMVEPIYAKGMLDQYDQIEWPF